jgi:pyroglutamyl-peptidase
MENSFYTMSQLYPQPQRQKTSSNRSKQQAKKTVVSCLITGFDTFGNNSFNPSEMVVNSLPEEIAVPQGTAVVSSAVLATCCKQSWKQLQQALSRTNPDVLLMTGLAQKRDRLSIERFALNIRDYRIPDNAGHTWKDGQIVRGAPEAMRTNVPLDELEEHLWDNDYPCEISNHAGTFVCNDAYFRALNYYETHDKPRIVLFVHLPLPAEFAQTALKSTNRNHPHGFRHNRQLQMQFMTEAVVEIARFCADLR